MLESRISRFTVAGGVLNPAQRVRSCSRIAQPYTQSQRRQHRVRAGRPAVRRLRRWRQRRRPGKPRAEPQHAARQDDSHRRERRRRLHHSGGQSIHGGGARCQAGTGASSSAICREIYAYGFRNPWRWSFDRASPTPDMWLGDVGQGACEEVDRIETRRQLRLALARRRALLQPATQLRDHRRTARRSSIRWRSTRTPSAAPSPAATCIAARRFPSLVGRYVFGDFGSGAHLRADPGFERRLHAHAASQTPARTSARSPRAATASCTTVDYGGSFFKLVRAPARRAIPSRRCSPRRAASMQQDPKQPASGLIPYAPVAPFWSDGARKRAGWRCPTARRSPSKPTATGRSRTAPCS